MFVSTPGLGRCVGGRRAIPSAVQPPADSLFGDAALVRYLAETELLSDVQMAKDVVEGPLARAGDTGAGERVADRPDADLVAARDLRRCDA